MRRIICTALIGFCMISSMPDSFETLAEDFQNAGYATASFAENALIDENFGFERGFDRFESPEIGRASCRERV